METKFIGIILLVCAALIFQYSYDDFMEAFFSPAEKLKITIEKDISKSLEIQAPKSKSNIHHVKFSYRSNEAHDFLKKHPPKFQTNKDGTIWLEVEVLDLPDDEDPGFITQTSIFDLKTKNKVGEFGETYHIKDFDQNTRIRLMGKSKPEPAKPHQEKMASEEKGTTTTKQDNPAPEKKSPEPTNPTKKLAPKTVEN